MCGVKQINQEKQKGGIATLMSLIVSKTYNHHHSTLFLSIHFYVDCLWYICSYLVPLRFFPRFAHALDTLWTRFGHALHTLCGYHIEGELHLIVSYMMCVPKSYYILHLWYDTVNTVLLSLCSEWYHARVVLYLQSAIFAKVLWAYWGGARRKHNNNNDGHTRSV